MNPPAESELFRHLLLKQLICKSKMTICGENESDMEVVYGWFSYS